MTLTLPRLRLHGNAQPSGRYDGGWWPRSSDLIEELPDLIETISGRMDDVAVIGYSAGCWMTPPKEVTIGGNLIHLQGFSALDADTVVVISRRGHAISLRVIPSSTNPWDAEAQLQASCSPGGSVETPLSVAEAHTESSLASVSGRLIRRFESDHLDSSLITGWVHEAAEELASAPIQAFVPVLVEHIVRARIRAWTAQDLHIVHAPAPQQW